MRWYVRLVVLANLLLIGVQAVRGQTAPDSAVVTGQVLDAGGRPVSMARISIFPMDVGISGPLPLAYTDREGKYRLISPPFGRTRFCAVKESAGYPDAQGLLFVSGSDSQPEISLTPGARLQLDIHLGPPDGIIQGRVIDATTQALVVGARITLRRDVPQAIYSALLPNGEFLFALPPVPIKVTISAPGYMPWSYNGPNGPSMVVASSDHQVLTVELKPKK